MVFICKPLRTSMFSGRRGSERTGTVYLSRGEKGGRGRGDLGLQDPGTNLIL